MKKRVKSKDYYIGAGLGAILSVAATYAAVQTGLDALNDYQAGDMELAWAGGVLSSVYLLGSMYGGAVTHTMHKMGKEARQKERETIEDKISKK